MSIRYSVVIPLKDEESNIIELVAEVEPVMERLAQPWEMILIDDGSSDATGSILNKLQNEKSYLRAISFDKNYGQSSAFDAGFRHARGEWVITLDGDGQNDPKDIPKLLEKSDSFDLVCGRRLKRKDTWFKRFISTIANRVRSRVCHDGVSDTGCSLKMYRTACLQKIHLYDGMHRFLPALFQINGFTVTEVPVNHRERTKGKTKYNLLNRSFNTIVDMWAVSWMRKRRLSYKIRGGEK